MAKKFADLLAALPEERQRRINADTDALLREIALSNLRNARDMSLAQLEENLGIKKQNVADMEKRTDIYISTFRKLIESMGGELDIVARFPNGDISIKTFSEI